MVAATSSWTCSIPAAWPAPCATRDGLNVHRHRPKSAVVDVPLQRLPPGLQRFPDWQGTRLSPGQILLILRGIARGVPTAKLAREVGVSRQHLLRLRHAIQARALAAADRSPLPDDQAEADEMYQNAGENCRVKANFAACQPCPPKRQ